MRKPRDKTVAKNAKPGLKLRVVIAPGVGLGPGKAGLLEAIGETGSIAASARKLGMTYKRAWHLVTALNEQFPHPLVTGEKGGKSGGGAALTDFGHEVLTSFRDMEKRASAAIEPSLVALRRKVKLSAR